MNYSLQTMYMAAVTDAIVRISSAKIVATNLGAQQLIS